jgi:hypothetical protein
MTNRRVTGLIGTPAGVKLNAWKEPAEWSESETKRSSTLFQPVIEVTVMLSVAWMSSLEETLVVCRLKPLS